MASIKDSLNELDALGARYEAEFRHVAAERLRDYVESVTDAVPRFGPNAYVCPCCGSGTGVNGHYTPAFDLFRKKNGEMAFKCHACGVTGDVFALAGLVNGKPSYSDQRKIVAAFLGVDLARRTSLDAVRARDGKAPRIRAQSELDALRKEASAHIMRCKEHVGETGFFAERGLTDETVERFKLGYDPKTKMAVIPFTGSYYAERSTEVSPDRKAWRKHRNPEGLKRRIFNLKALSSPAVFVTEAPIDAMSIVQSGGAAIALGGASAPAFDKVLDVYRPDACFILAFDADGPGRKARAVFSEMLRRRGCPFTFPTHPAFTNYKDANAALMESPTLLKTAVDYEQTRALAALALSRKERVPGYDDFSAAKRDARASAAAKNALRTRIADDRKALKTIGGR